MSGFLSLTLVDGFGRQTYKRLEMTDQILLQGYIDNGNALLTALQAITDLEIIRADLVLGSQLTLPGADPTGSNIDVGATFSGLSGDGENKKITHKVPGIKLALVGSGGTVDVTQTDVAAYLDLFGDPPDNKFQLSDGEYVESWITGQLDRK